MLEHPKAKLIASVKLAFLKKVLTHSTKALSANTKMFLLLAVTPCEDSHR